MSGVTLAAALFATAPAVATPPPIMSVPPAPPARLMRWPDLLNRPRPNPTRAVFYGDDPNQLAELWLPQGRGPHPVVVLIHGGCWEAATATHTYLNYAAEDLRRRGLAVYNIEYRSVDQTGGGYPGTFQDVAAAIDRLEVEAPKAHLTLRHMVVVGHSAGGQLALWAAAAHPPAQVQPAALGRAAGGLCSRRHRRHSESQGRHPHRLRWGRHRQTGRPAQPDPAGRLFGHVARGPVAVGRAPGGDPRRPGRDRAAGGGPGLRQGGPRGGRHCGLPHPARRPCGGGHPGQPAWEDAAAAIVALAHGEPVR